MSHAIRANRNQQFLLPPSMDDWVADSHPARFIADLTAELDLAALGFRESPGEEGRPHFAAELLLGVWLLGWMQRIRSTRRLEEACHRDVGFIWLAGMLRPDHITLWRFFNDNKAALKKLFKLVVQTAAKAGLVGLALHAVDGTKLQAASSTETANHRKRLEEELKRIDKVIEVGMEEIEATEKNALDPAYPMPEALRDPSERKKEIQAALKQLEEAESEHLHPSEPEARVVKTRDGLRLGYNAQIVVDHDSDMIVAADVVNEATDHGQLVPMLEQVRDTLKATASETVADAGYASGEGFQEAERRHLPVIVAVQEESSKGDYAKSKFTYERDRDVYVCPKGEVLPLAQRRKATTGKPAMQVYRCGNADCPVKADCTKSKTGRTIKRLLTEDAFERQVARQSTPDKKILYSLRKEIVEHVFGIAKWVDGFRRFTVRGLDGANAQWSLACLAINLRKLLPAVHAGGLRTSDFVP